MYSELYTRERFKLPIVHFAVALIVVVLAGGYMYISSTPTTSASKKTILNHEVVNLTPRQAGIIWQSESAEVGWVLYGAREDSLDLIALDARDLSNEKKQRTQHYVVLKNINPDTRYFYQIVTGNQRIVRQDGKSFDLRTPPSTGMSGIASPIYGKVHHSSGEPAVGIPVIVRIAGALPFFTFSGQNGEWLVSLQYAIQKEKLTFLTLDEKTVVQIDFNADGQTSSVRAQISTAHPLPETIILGKNYTFFEKQSVLGAQSSSQRNSPTTFEVSLRYPRDGSVIPGEAPLIKGFGFPGRSVVVTINSQPAFKGQAIVDARGEWSIPVSIKLQPGVYVLTMYADNAQGRPIINKHSFTIIRSGERVLGVFSPSTSPQPTPTLAQLPTIPPTVTQSPMAPTTTSTPFVTNTPNNMSPTDVPPIDYNMQPKPPVSGGGTMPYAIAGSGLLMIGAGILFLF